MTLEDASFYGAADSKILRAFQGKHRLGFPSTYSRAGFDYFSMADKRDIMHDMERIYTLNWTEVMEALQSKYTQIHANAQMTIPETMLLIGTDDFIRIITRSIKLRIIHKGGVLMVIRDLQRVQPYGKELDLIKALYTATRRPSPTRLLE